MGFGRREGSYFLVFGYWVCLQIYGIMKLFVLMEFITILVSYHMFGDVDNSRKDLPGLGKFIGEDNI